MEGMPRFPMVAPEMKVATSSYQDDFSLKLKEHILLHYQDDPSNYDNAIKEIMDLKKQLINPAPDVETACLLKRYYAQLLMMKSRFPMEPGDPIDVSFSWSDRTMDMPNTVAYEDINFELACVMFNIGAVHATIAANESRENDESIKNAFMHFQYSAWPLHQVRDTMSAMKYSTIDFDKDVLTFFVNVLLGQAQECLVEKSLIDHRSNAVIAKLSVHLRDLYRECAKHLESSTLCDAVASYKYKEWVHTVAAKSEFYGAIAMLYMGMQAEEDQKMGARLGYYTQALKHVKKLGIHRVRKAEELLDLQAGMDIVEKDKSDGMQLSASFIYDVVAAKEQNAKKENDFIYHERVPKDEELALTEGLAKVKPHSFDPLDPSVGGEDLFSSLLPPTVLKAVSQYEEEKAKLKRSVLERIAEKDHELNEYLTSLGVDELCLDGDGVPPLPDILLERNAAFNSQPDAFPQLLDKLNRVSHQIQEFDTKFPELLGRLNAVNLPHLISDDGFRAIKSEVLRLNDTHLQSRPSTAELQKIVAAQSDQLRILALPLHQLADKLGGTGERPADTPEGAALKRILDKTSEMKAQRVMLIQRLDDEMHRDTVAKKLLSERDHDNTGTFSKELEKHSETIGFIDQNLTAQDKILHALTEANADFADFRRQRNAKIESRNEQVMSLVAAYEVYADVLNKVDQALELYSTLQKKTQRLMPALEGIEHAFKMEVEKREAEKHALQEKIEKIKRDKEARDAMSDFNGPGNGPGGPYEARQSPLGPTPPLTGAGGRRDYMEFFRAKMGGGAASGAGTGMPPMMGGRGMPSQPSGPDPSMMYVAPPSPTPSLVSNFPSPGGFDGSRGRVAHSQMGGLPGQHGAPPPPPQQQPVNQYMHDPVASRTPQFMPTSAQQPAVPYNGAPYSPSPVHYTPPVAPPVDQRQPQGQQYQPHPPQHYQYQQPPQQQIPPQSQPTQPVATHSLNQYSNQAPVPHSQAYAGQPEQAWNQPTAAPVQQYQHQSQPTHPHVSAPSVPHVSQGSYAPPLPQPVQQPWSQPMQQPYPVSSTPAPQTYTPTQATVAGVPTPVNQNSVGGPGSAAAAPAPQAVQQNMQYVNPGVGQPQATQFRSPMPPANGNAGFVGGPQQSHPSVGGHTPYVDAYSTQPFSGAPGSGTSTPLSQGIARGAPSLGSMPPLQPAGQQNMPKGPEPSAAAVVPASGAPHAFHPIQPAKPAIGSFASVANPHPMYPQGAATQGQYSNSPWHQGAGSFMGGAGAASGQNQMRNSVNGTVPPQQPQQQMQQPQQQHPQYQAQHQFNNYQPPGNQSAPQHNQSVQPQPQGQQQTTLDLLGDILGDLHLPPALQPQPAKLEPHPPVSVPNNSTQCPSSNGQTSSSNTPSSSSLSTLSMSVTQKPSTNYTPSNVNFSSVPSQSVIPQPTAVVAPMPKAQQQPPNPASGQQNVMMCGPTSHNYIPPVSHQGQPSLSQVSLNSNQSTASVPTTGSSVPSSQQRPLPLSEITDPSKFELGPEERQKLDKRLLHASFKGAGAKPSMDPSDPLNALDPFWKAK